MKNLFLALLTSLVFLGCSSDTQVAQNVEPQLVVGNSLENLKLQDQFEKEHSLQASTKKVLFAFSKDMAHTCNDYFVTKEADYLAKNNTQFVADVSNAPSLIKSMFIMPGLKDFKHTVLLFNEKGSAEPFKAGVDAEKIVVVYVDGMKITEIKTVATVEELVQVIEN
jgi:hypothetical protein